MSLIALGINHKTASLAVREKAAFADHELGEVMAELKETIDDSEVALLSTCNRVEFYVSNESKSAEELKAGLLEWLKTKKALAQDLDEAIYCHQDLDAVSHLMQVASGLDSMVLGEPQILGQLKACYQKAKRAGTVEQVMERLFQKTFSAAKRVRHETEIGSNPVSVAYAAVSLARHIFADFSKLTVLFVGAGETIELAARHLEQSGVHSMVMANRTLANAQHLASEFEGKAVGLEAIPHYLAQADIVISSTGSMLPIIGKGMVESAVKERRRKSMFMVDLAVPRDIESSVANLDDVYLYTVDDLEGVIQENLQARQEAAQEAQGILKEFVEDFQKWHAGRQKHDTVRELQQVFNEVAQAELERVKAQLKNGGDVDEALEHFTHRLTKKFLHQPMVWLREEDDEWDRHQITRQLFQLDKSSDD
ncbi:glutamyl-tRNA reductase [Kangiella shandongensis]|uniref:glutamyl-tRNA reductase n=1 Tax=Kangiella shandongensis TaxID=2763258 RepID=UPI001CBAE457|nr:glutamyl-tRNA reductase [Kangiella shandongensis]